MLLPANYKDWESLRLVLEESGLQYVMPPDAASLTAQLKDAARRLGFSRAAACPAVSPEGATRLVRCFSGRN